LPGLAARMASEIQLLVGAYEARCTQRRCAERASVLAVAEVLRDMPAEALDSPRRRAMGGGGIADLCVLLLNEPAQRHGASIVIHRPIGGERQSSCKAFSYHFSPTCHDMKSRA
jgi:hypothetical protein